MNELLEMEEVEKEEIEIEVTNEYGEIIYNGTYEEFLAQNDYDEELEEVLNQLQNSRARQISFFGFFASEYIIREVA